MSKITIIERDGKLRYAVLSAFRRQ